MLKGLSQKLLINRICPIPLMFLQGVLVDIMELGPDVINWYRTCLRSISCAELEYSDAS